MYTHMYSRAFSADGHRTAVVDPQLVAGVRWYACRT